MTHNEIDPMITEIHELFPFGPKTAEDQAKVHLIMYKYDKDIRHVIGNGFISVLYEANGEYPTEVYVYESPGVCLHTETLNE